MIGRQVIGVKITGPGKPVSKYGKFLRDVNRSKYLLLLALPCFIYLVIFRFLPMYGIIISFYDYNAFSGISGSKFVGFDQYISFFKNVDFFNILRNTFLLGLYRLIWTFPVPIILALVINEVRHMGLKKFVQTVSYLPHFISVAVIAGMTIMFLNPNNGLINNIIVMLGGQPNYFMSKPEYFRAIYIITDIWQGAGWGSIIYLAAISSIGSELYESAVLDGANKFKQILHITLPGIAQTIVIMFILNTGSIVSIGFDKPFLLQNTLNMSTADVLSTYVYRKGIQYMNYSFATAAGLFNSVISLIFVYATNFMSRKFGENNLF